MVKVSGGLLLLECVQSVAQLLVKNLRGQYSTRFFSVYLLITLQMACGVNIPLFAENTTVSTVIESEEHIILLINSKKLEIPGKK